MLCLRFLGSALWHCSASTVVVRTACCSGYVASTHHWDELSWSIARGITTISFSATWNMYVQVWAVRCVGELQVLYPVHSSISLGKSIQKDLAYIKTS